MDEYLDIYHRHFEGFESTFFDAKTVTRPQAFALFESLTAYYERQKLPEKPVGEHWPHIGEFIYPIRPAAVWRDLGMPLRAKQVEQAFHAHYIPEIMRALLFSHGVVLWDPVYWDLCRMHRGGLDAEQAFISLKRDRLFTIQDLADPIRSGLIRMTPYQDITACVGDFLDEVGFDSSDPESFLRVLQQIVAELGHDEAQKVVAFLHYNAGWVGYRLRFERKFDLCTQFSDDLVGLRYALNAAGSPLDQTEVDAVRLLASGCQFDPSSTVSTRDLLKIRNDDDAFVEWRELLKSTLGPFSSADIVDRQELKDRFVAARARAGANFKRAKTKSPRIRKMLSAGGEVTVVGLAAQLIDTVASGGASTAAVGIAAAAAEGVNQLRQHAVRNRGIERAKQHHIMVLEHVS